MRCNIRNRFANAIVKVNVLTCLLIVISVNSAFAAPPILSNPILADVSDRSFSLIWTTDQPGELLVEIFNDEAASLPFSGFSVLEYGVKTGASIFSTADSVSRKVAIENAIKAKGIAKVTVSGLLPNTSYYLKYGITGTSTQETTLCPDPGVLNCPDTSATLLHVHTENKVTRGVASSEVLLNDVLLHLDANATQGELVLISIESTNYPVSAIVGDVVPVPYALIDLNNYFNAISGESSLLQSKVTTTQGNSSNALSIMHYRGLAGASHQLAVLDQANGTGNVAGALSKNIGDCNADGIINGYDNILLSNHVAGVFSALEDEEISFHKFICNLHADSGLNFIDSDVLINNLDLSLHSELLVGKQNSNSLPVIP